MHFQMVTNLMTSITSRKVGISIRGGSLAGPLGQQVSNDGPEHKHTIIQHIVCSSTSCILHAHVLQEWTAQWAAPAMGVN